MAAAAAGRDTHHAHCLSAGGDDGTPSGEHAGWMAGARSRGISNNGAKAEYNKAHVGY